jgi:hypothetical protein
MDRILFGDNQFFGINHMSEDKARVQAMKFRDSSAIMKVLDDAYDLGIKTFMCTTHDVIEDVCSFVRENPRRYEGFKFYPGMPYAHKYANAVTEDGILGALKRFTSGSVFGTVLKGGEAIMTQDVTKLMKLLVDAEMKMFRGLSTEVIFLQNVLVDLLLGLGMKKVFIEYAKYIKESYGAEPGFITMNVPRLLDTLEECGIENPIVCSSINKSGFRMSGGIEAYEKALNERRFRPIAMSVMASGAISPEEAIRYVCSFKKIESIVFGASSKNHISQTKDLITKFSI